MKTTGIVVRTWNDAPITRRDSDGYADATAMCQANGKLWGHYREAQRTTDYITALADATGLDADQLIISTKGGPAHLQGTWIHPRLAVDLARWISPQFAVWMDGWFLDAVAAPSLPITRPQQTTIGHDRLVKIIPQCDLLTSRVILSRLGLPNTRANQMALSMALRPLGYCRHRFMIQGRRHWIYTKTDRLPRFTAAATPALPPGIHVVANTPRQANWLWAQAVEDHVSRALMTQVAASNHREPPATFQLHLLPAA